MRLPPTPAEGLPDRPVRGRSLLVFHGLTSVVMVVGTVILVSRTLMPPGVNTPPKPNVDIPTGLQPFADAHILGVRTAPVGVIVFSDFECPFCKTLARDVLPIIHRPYIERGRVFLAFRQFPITRIHRHAMAPAVATECAAEQGKFWQAHDRLFALDMKLTSPVIVEVVAGAGVNRSEFMNCLDREPMGRVSRDLEAGKSLPVRGTPYVLIGRRRDDGIEVSRVFNGAPAVESFVQAIDTALQAK